MINLKYIIFLLTILLVQSCCKKCDDKPRLDYVPINDNLKPYLFDVGSYWVYRNDSTGVEDSIVVLSAERNILYVPNEDTSYETWNHAYQKNASSTYNEMAYFLVIARVNNFQSLGGQGVFSYAEALGASEGISYINFYPSLILNNKPYSNVRQFLVHYNTGCNGCFTDTTSVCYAPNIGIIKWVEHQPSGVQSFSLLRHSIETIQF